MPSCFLIGYPEFCTLIGSYHVFGLIGMMTLFVVSWRVFGSDRVLNPVQMTFQNHRLHESFDQPISANVCDDDRLHTGLSASNDWVSSASRLPFPD